MAVRNIARALLLGAPAVICGCIGTTQSTASGATAPAQPQSNSSAHSKKAKPCEAPEMTTGDVASVGTAPCAGPDLETEQRTWEPPEEIHPD